MRERPILFSAPMVRAILEGRKTQTRRIVKFKGDAPKTIFPLLGRDNQPTGEWFFSDPIYDRVGRSGHFCPQGKPGDRLWVKEAWQGCWHPTKANHNNFHITYAADGSERFTTAPALYALPKVGLKPGNLITSIYMPRWASRITLEIIDIRVQRLQEISEEDSVAEGLEAWTVTQSDLDDMAISDASPDVKELSRLMGLGTFPARGEFQMLWAELHGYHGDRSWGGNPWVWATTFRELKGAGAP